MLGGAGSAKDGRSWLASGEKPASLGALGCLGGTRALASTTQDMLADGTWLADAGPEGRVGLGLRVKVSSNLNPSPNPNLDELPFVGACEADYTGAKLGHKIEAAQRRGAAEVGLGFGFGL